MTLGQRPPAAPRGESGWRGLSLEPLLHLDFHLLVPILGCGAPALGDRTLLLFLALLMEVSTWQLQSLSPGGNR